MAGREPTYRKDVSWAASDRARALLLGRELKVEPDHLAELRRLAAKLGGQKRKGMTEKNASRLRRFRNRETQLALLNLPSVLVEKAAREQRPVKAARLVEAAVAIGLVCVCPVRLKNLAAIEIDRHFDRPQRGKLYFVVPSSEVKNERPLEFELPSRLIDLIDRFLEYDRKHLVSRSCPWLFAREDGRGPVHKTVLARRITDTIGRELGVEMNPHLFRHFAAMIILERDPGAYDLVRRLLGHSELSTTVDAYSGMETLRATQWFGELVEESQREAPARRRNRR
jgi:integrase